MSADKQKIPCMVLTVDELAESLGVHRSVATAAIENGSIRARRIGERWFVPKHALDEFLEGRDNPRQVYTAGEVADALGLHVNTVARMLQAGTIRARKAGKNWQIPHSALEEYLAGKDN